MVNNHPRVKAQPEGEGMVIDHKFHVYIPCCKYYISYLIGPTSATRMHEPENHSTTSLSKERMKGKWQLQMVLVPTFVLVCASGLIV